MKVLVVSGFIPYPPDNGGLWRVYGLVSNLARSNDVVLLAPVRRPTDPEGIQHLESLGIHIEAVTRPPAYGKFKAVMARVKALFSPVPAHWVLTWDDYIGQVISSAVKKHSPDVIYIQHLSTYRFYEWFGTEKLLVLDEHNVESALEQQIVKTAGGWMRKWQARKIGEFERMSISRMDLVVAVSDIDKRDLQAMCPGIPIVTVENGVELQYFRVKPSVDSSSVVFTGTLNYPPNVEAAKYLVEDILPHILSAEPDIHLKIVGRQPDQSVNNLIRPGVEVIANVPDIRPYVEEAGVMVVPLKSGSGTRIKILEAMAVGKAIVSTHKGAEGLDVRDGYDILLRDDAEGFAEAVVSLLRDPEKRTQIGANARSTVESKYGYDALARKLDDEFRRALNLKHGSKT